MHELRDALDALSEIRSRAKGALDDLSDAPGELTDTDQEALAGTSSWVVKRVNGQLGPPVPTKGRLLKPFHSPGPGAPVVDERGRRASAKST